MREVNQQRPIKFRVWNVDTKRMNKITAVNVWGSAIHPRFEGEQEIMQYTSLKDKNDVEIYEGDIIRLTSKAPHVDVEVRWEDKFAGFTTGPEDQESFSHMFGSHLCEVIGNIYENPELLK